MKESSIKRITIGQIPLFKVGRSRTLMAGRSRCALRLLFGILICFVSISCQQKTFDTKEELLAYVANPENGYMQRKNINGVDFSITYRPTDMLVLQSLGDDANDKELDSLRNKYKQYMYFNLSLSINNQEVLNGMGKNRSEFGAMVNQLAFGMADKVHVYTKKKDTVAMTEYIYPRMYGMGGGTKILFIYPRESTLINDHFFHFTIEDIGLATGEVGFKIPVAPIMNEPGLKF